MPKQFLVHKKIMFLSLGFLAIFVLSGCESKLVSNKSITNDVKVSRQVQGGQVAVLDSDLIVTSPLSNDVLENLVIVKGRTRSSNPIEIILLDANELLIVKTTNQNDSGLGGWEFFENILEFEDPATPTGWLVVTSIAADSSRSDSIKLPVGFKNYKLPTVQVFFGNNIEDPEGLNCSKVYSVERQVPSVNQAIVGSINHLFVGPVGEEAEQGFNSSLPSSDVQVLNMDIKEGIFVIDFNKSLVTSDTTECQIKTINAQISQTLQQFEGVSSVQVLVNGEVDEALILEDG